MAKSQSHTPKPFNIDKANRDTKAISDITGELLDVIHALPQDERAGAFWQLALDLAYESTPARVRKARDVFMKRLEKQAQQAN